MTTNKKQTESIEKQQIWESLRDPEFRRQFTEEHVVLGVPFWIRALRKSQHLTQEDLANLLEGNQSLISDWENPEKGLRNLSTLIELAKAFEVGLLVRPVPFSVLIDWTLDADKDAPMSFGEEDKERVKLGLVAPSDTTVQPMDKTAISAGHASLAHDIGHDLPTLGDISASNGVEVDTPNGRNIQPPVGEFKAA